MAVPTKEPRLIDAADPAALVPHVQSESTAFLSLVERLAIDPRVDVDKLERLLKMQREIVSVQAEAAFNRAFAAMLPEIPTIIERAKADKATYAPLEDIVEAVRPILTRHGFTVSHRTEWPDAKTVKVVGILTHVDGHTRTSEFLSGADQTGSKNAIQALGSAVSYGKRYTFKDLLCIVTRGEDDDAKRAGRKPIGDAPAGFEEWVADMTACADEGTPRLAEAWNKSKPDYKKHLAALDGWEPLKARAAKATKAGRS